MQLLNYRKYYGNVSKKLFVNIHVGIDLITTGRHAIFFVITFIPDVGPVKELGNLSVVSFSFYSWVWNVVLITVCCIFFSILNLLYENDLM